jgi:hypothetical protein
MVSLIPALFFFKKKGRIKNPAPKSLKKNKLIDEIEDCNLY